MADSGENRTAGITIDFIVAKNDTNAIQQTVFAKWIQTRDNSIFPPKESIEKTKCTCGCFDEHLFGSTHRCPRHHGVRISSRNLEDQNRSKSMLNKEVKRSSSAHAVSRFYNKQPASAEKSSKEPLSGNVKMNLGKPRSGIPISMSFIDQHQSSGDKKSKIPIRIKGYRFTLPEPDTGIDDSKSMIENQNYTSFDDV